jgi:hypothetical protein
MYVLYKSTSCHECYGGYGRDHDLLSQALVEATATSMLFRLLAMTFNGRL